jgi:hypothetical protein
MGDGVEPALGQGQLELQQVGADPVEQALAQGRGPVERTDAQVQRGLPLVEPGEHLVADRLALQVGPDVVQQRQPGRDAPARSPDVGQLRPVDRGDRRPAEAVHDGGGPLDAGFGGGQIAPLGP